jgi:hypothetical protein
VLVGAADACTIPGALFKAVFCEFSEQPEMENRMPVDTNKATFFIVVSSQVLNDGRNDHSFLSLGFRLRTLNSPEVQVCSEA